MAKIRERYAHALDNVSVRLRNYDRTPFVDLLAIYTEMFPSAEALEAFAERFPDKYLVGLNALARTAGFTDKTEATVNVTVNVRTMSDSQLEDRLALMASELQIKRPPIIDITPGEAMGIDQPKMGTAQAVQAQVAGLPEDAELKTKGAK